MVYAGQLDSLVLEMLCVEPGPWADEELAREFGKEGVQARDCLRRLIARGLALRLMEGFVIASAAGRYAHAVNEETP